jgi:hypothetical protein
MTDKDLEKLHNKYVADLRQEHNRFHAEVKARLDAYEVRIREIVVEELTNHVLLLQQTVQNIEAKLKHHLG